jgi:hypothetical protein
MRTALGAGVLLVAMTAAVVGCSSSDTAPAPAAATTPAATDAGAEAEAAAQLPDPQGGRTAEASSCFAACQNTGFTCAPRGAASAVEQVSVQLETNPAGCAGTLSIGTGTASEQQVPVVIECLKKTFCRADAPGGAATTCAAATFSAFAFAYVPSGAAVETICTRD